MYLRGLEGSIMIHMEIMIKDDVNIEMGVVQIKKGLRVYSSKKIVLTEQEKEDYEKRIQKQMEKYQRDLKCGGIDCNGNFTRLHDRNEMYY